MLIDYYKILGLNRNANQEQIEKAYSKLVKKYHPDLHPMDMKANQKFQLINDAHEALSVNIKKRKYDKYLKETEHANPFFESDNMDSLAAPSVAAVLKNYQNLSVKQITDFFESIFFQPPSYSEPPTLFRGKDIYLDYKINLSELRQATERILEVNNKKIRITLPAGIRNKQIIKIKNLGGPGKNEGPNGDLIITFNVINDTNYRRSGADMFKKVEVDIFTALLGGELEIDTLHGKAKLKIKPGSKSGDKVILKGRGFNEYREDNKYGDFIAELILKIPASLNNEQQQLYEQFNKEVISE